MFSDLLIENDLFQSTLPVWGATSEFKRTLAIEGISIHAPRVGSDAASLI